MEHEVTFLPQEHVCIVTHYDGWDKPEALAKRAREIRQVLANASEKVFFIMDLSKTKMTVDGVMRSANQMARGSNAPFHHPMCRGVALVTGEEIARLVARGLRTETFGNLNVDVYASVEEAVQRAASAG